MSRRRSCLLVTIAGVLLGACVSDAPEESPIRADGERDVSRPVASGGTGSLRGVVRDAATDRPIEGALVTAGDATTSTDADGAFVIPSLPVGEWSVSAYRRGFEADSAAIVAAAGRVASLEFSLPPAAPPCCHLAGRWSARFRLDSAGIDVRPTSRELAGVLAFVADSVAGPDRIAAAAGSSELDFGPILGSDGARVGELEGVVFAGDSVAVTLLPRFGDWAIELRGRHASDTIRGDWFQRASCCGAYGTFELVRDGS